MDTPVEVCLPDPATRSLPTLFTSPAGGWMSQTNEQATRECTQCWVPQCWSITAAISDHSLVFVNFSNVNLFIVHFGCTNAS